MPDDLRDAFVDFMQERTREKYLELRARFVTSISYHPYASDLEELHQLCDQGEYQSARDKAHSIMIGYLLTPGVHLYLSYAEHQLGNEEAARTAMDIGAAMLKAIARTGDGSPEQPYLVTRIQDEHDLLRHYLKKEWVQQELNEKDDRSYDVITCEDGTKVWFDVTDMFAKQRGRGPS